MKFCHISDTHSTFPTINKQAEFVVHSGDFFPNFKSWINGFLVEEANNQKAWIINKIDDIKYQLQDRDYLFIPGNHDFLHPEILQDILVSNGINAINLSEKLVSHKGLNFYGFPYVPYIEGRWNYEKFSGPMDDEFDKVLAIMNSTKVDILVCHSAPAGVLDVAHNEHLGSTIITNGIFYKLARDMMPSHVLFGHIHESNGIEKIEGITFSNAATTVNYFKV